MEKRMTQKDFYNEIIALAEANGRTDIVDFCNGRIEVLSKKSGSKKATKTQVENVGIKEDILAVLTSEGATVSEIQSKSEALSGYSNQKLSALLRQLVEAGLVVKSTDKKKSVFALANAE